MVYISHVSVSLLRNSNVLNRVYPTHKKRAFTSKLATPLFLQLSLNSMFQHILYKNPIPSSVAYEVCHKSNTALLTPFAALRERNMPVTEDILSKKGLFGEDIYKLIFVKNNPSNEDLTEIKSLADKNGLRICFEDGEYLEFCVKSSDKGVATRFLKERFGIIGETVAFGDTEGDYAMFEKADRVFIPKGAKDFYFSGAIQIEDVQNFIVNEF